MIEENDNGPRESCVGAQSVPIRWKFERDAARELKLVAIRPRCPCNKRHRDMPEFSSWRHMVRRCTDPKDDSWRHYGGRGITVCERWLVSFHDFADDMGPRPVGTWIERIDNDCGYEPSNCVWATPVVQGRNKRGVRLSEETVGVARQMLADGETTQAVADVLGVSKSCIKRLGRRETWR